MSAMREKSRVRIAVRNVRVNDSAVIARLLGELGYPTEASAVRRRLGQIRRSQGSHVLVAVARGNVVGVVGMQLMPLLHRDRGLCRILAISVDADYTRRGVGTRLLKAAESLAGRAGCHRVELTTAPERTGAHKFYRRLGYERASVRFAKTIV